MAWALKRLCIIGLLVLLLLAVGGAAFAPSLRIRGIRPSYGSSNTCSHGLRRIIQGRACNKDFLSVDKNCRRSTVCRYGKAAATANGDEEAVHAISRAFLAEQEASGRALKKYDQKWWAQFQELEEYKREIGDCNVPWRYNANPQLGKWVSNQRQRYRQNKLNSERIEALESVGFEWVRPKGGGHPDDANWWNRFEELEEYKHEHGDCNVPRRYTASPQLGNWVIVQRQAYKRKDLSNERIDALERIGFEWIRGGQELDEKRWWKRYSELEEYKQEHGDCNVPRNYKANPQLGVWANHQRQNYQKNKLNSERIEALESIGFEWTRPTGVKPDDANWWKRFGELKEYKEKQGDCNVPINYHANMQLAKWVMNQRAYYHQFIDENWKRSPGITKVRIEALDEIGFEWRLRDRPEWDERYDELVAYKNQHGDTLVPTDTRRGKENKYCELAMWVNTQRSQYRLLQEGKHSQLTDERIEKLNQIGFAWDAHEAVWEERFAELVSYKEMHGDTLVRGASQLGNWVSVQRTFYRWLQEGKPSYLTNERIERLNQIGFVWDAQEAAWEEKFAELVEFKATHGHTDVPRSWENNQLNNFVGNQRRFYKKFKEEGKMVAITKERIERLDSIGFEWRSKQTYQWKIRFGELRDFYDENGAVPVPSTKMSLYKWACRQKKEYDKFVRGEKTNMDETRIADLKSIGFFEAYGK